MSASLPSPKSPVVLVLLGGAALWLLSRRAGAAAVRPVSANTQQTYYTPTGVAELLAKSVVAITKNIATPAATGANATPQVPSLVNVDAASQGAFGWDGHIDSLGRFFGLGGPTADWSRPSTSFVAAPASGGSSGIVDSNPFAAVYNPGEDTVFNPDSYLFGS